VAAETRARVLIESIPNVSEGRRQAITDELADVIRQTPRVRLLDRSSDRSHNRTVYTLVGDAASLQAASLALVASAVARIDLRQHQGVHPRIGAVDVMPFAPLADAAMSDCVALARKLGELVANRFGLPVFLYEEAALRLERRRLEHIRRGEFEGLSAKLADPEWMPDYGPPVPHPTAGAIAIGARQVLIAFNVELATDRLDIARRVATHVRERTGGLPAVKALGLPLVERGTVQVSMNLTDYRVTPPRVAFTAVEHEATRLGVSVVRSELVGLLPQAALIGTTATALKLDGFRDDQILEVRLARTLGA
jgi:glutamate formiminotransferase